MNFENMLQWFRSKMLHKILTFVEDDKIINGLIHS